ncbi:protein eva-1 homolog C isoform X2 [Sciurus carolinensis]|uniref:protein eva-1 homolog C isoform X2 n=1 Tax=Sciurus carolinensis TaxID=30640 RepID=UPI001FB1DD5C|nr:protein eva-1 homolog C isoform X2 [Sciurus carolinensis]
MGITECLVTAHGAQRVVGTAVLLSHAFRTPLSLGPRQGGSRTELIALPLKCVTGTGRAARPTRVKLALSQRGLGQECRAVSRLRTRAWKALKLRRLGSVLGGALLYLLRVTTGLRSLPRVEAMLSLRPPPSLFPSEQLQRRFPLGETTRILPGAPRPAPVLRPLPFAGDPGLGRFWEAEAPTARRRRGAVELQATDAPSHVTPPSCLRSPGSLGPCRRPTAQRTMRLAGRARPPPAPQHAQHPGLRRQVEPPGQLLRLFYCTVLVCSREIAALTDFSGYLTKLLQNHTAYACDGDHLNLQCPRHSTISVQSAFYGQDDQVCSPQQPASQREDSLTCVAPTTLQVLDECQNRRACHLLVNSRVFGPDLCPGSSKYLLVSFKCQPNELKNATVCEDQELRLHCHQSKFLNIYSASYGRRAQERDACASDAQRLPPFDCVSYSALQVLSRRCYGKQRCKITVNNYHFGSPCLPGVKKYLTVTYACVPKHILTAIDPAIVNLKPSLKQKDAEHGIKSDPSESKVLRKDGVIVSNSLAAFAYIRAHPERAALLFVSSVCIGLTLTLCALVIRVSCTKDFQELQLGREHLVPGSDKAGADSEEEAEEEDSSDSEFPGELAGFCRTSYPAYSSIEAAELAERIERREQIIQEIWMNSGLDTSLPRNLGPFY